MILNRRVSKHVFSGSVMVIITMLFLIVVVIKAPNQRMNYLLAVIPPIIGACTLLYQADKSGSIIPSVVTLLFAFIIICGNAYQIVLGENSPFKTFMLNFVALIGAGISITVYIKLIKKRLLNSKRGYLLAIYSIGGTIFALFMILLLFGTTIGGARLWLKIGSLTIELSEINKLFFCFLLSLIYNSNMGVRNKIIYGIIALGVSSLFLVLLNEFGTVIILFVVYLISFYIHIRSRYSLLMISGIILVMVIALAVIFGTHEGIKDSNGFFADKLNKIYDRLVLADTDQVTRAIQGMINGGAFGADPNYIISYYSIEADFSLAGIAQYFGLIAMLLCVCFVATIVYLVFSVGRNNTLNNRSRYKLSFILMSAIAVQTLLSLAGNIGLPCAGVGLSGISAGGTQLLTFYIEAAFIIYGLLENNVVEPYSISTGYSFDRRNYSVEDKV